MNENLSYEQTREIILKHIRDAEMRKYAHERANLRGEMSLATMEAAIRAEDRIIRDSQAELNRIEAAHYAESNTETFNPTKEKELFNIAVALLDQGDFDNAFKAFQRLFTWYGLFDRLPVAFSYQLDAIKWVKVVQSYREMIEYALSPYTFERYKNAWVSHSNLCKELNVGFFNPKNLKAPTQNQPAVPTPHIQRFGGESHNNPQKTNATPQINSPSGKKLTPPAHTVEMLTRTKELLAGIERSLVYHKHDFESGNRNTSQYKLLVADAEERIAELNKKIEEYRAILRNFDFTEAD
jgi:tetratricopeptide (TPR) repeat protein